MKNVIELIRVSTEAQAGDDRASLAAQRATNRRTAAHHGLKIVETIEIVDVSGSEVLASPEMQRLLQRICNSQIDGVVAFEFSRLMRPEQIDDFLLLGAFQKTKTMLYLPDSCYDFSKPDSRMMGMMKAMMAGFERQQLKERSMAAKEQMRREGRCPSSRITWPFGVAYSKERGWYYTPEAQKVRRIFKMFLGGEISYSRISQAVGISRFTVAVIIENPIYMGWRVYDKRRDQSTEGKYITTDGRQGDRRKIVRTDDDVIRVKVIEPGLISEAEFDKAQAIVEAKKSRHWKRRDPQLHEDFVYMGFLTCAACTNPVYTISSKSVKNRTTGQKNEYHYYVCRGRVGTGKDSGNVARGTCSTEWMKRERLEEKLDNLFSGHLTDKGWLNEMAQEMVRRRTDRGAFQRIERMKASLAQQQSKRKRLIDVYAEGSITKQDFNDRIVDIDLEIARLQDELLKESPDSGATITPRELALILQPFHEWQFLNRNHKRRLLTVTVPEIHVANYNVHGICVLPSGNRYHAVTTTPVAAAYNLRDYETHRKKAY